jgi:hypothetical protein
VISTARRFSLIQSLAVVNFDNPLLKPAFSAPAILTQSLFAVRYASFRNYQSCGCRSERRVEVRGSESAGKTYYTPGAYAGCFVMAD